MVNLFAKYHDIGGNTEIECSVTDVVTRRQHDNYVVIVVDIDTNGKEDSDIVYNDLTLWHGTYKQNQVYTMYVNTNITMHICHNPLVHSRTPSRTK